MLARYENRVQLVLALVVGLLLVANLFTLTLVAMTPPDRSVRPPVLFAVFMVTLFVSLPGIFLLPRWLMRPYRQLVGEAERAPVAAARPEGARDETEFVLETFQAVVAQLRAQQRELEKLSAQASARAASAEMFNERVVASVPSGLVAFDASGLATVINPPARALLEVQSNATGQHLSTLLRLSPELTNLVERCLRTGELYRREEVAATTGEGRVRRLGVTVAPVDPQAGNGGAHGALCLLTDITEVAQLREALALKRNLESLGEMSAGLAHEFKNALATLHGYAQLLQNLELDERGQSASSALLQEVRSLTQMVTAFLNFARPQPLQLAEVSIRELLADCASELQPFYEARRVSFELSGEFPIVRADELMLRQALLNLLRNAAEAFEDSEQAERRVSVQGYVETGDGGKNWFVLSVEDTGTGISESELQRIFIPFFTTKSKGHGIGLALAHRVVTEHGGTLTAANAPAGGAVFTLRLPLETP
ncbi:MAG TPA: ATP-binding protein [Pyrinomonadaceae bacterium]|jgi:nitrogen fixation/metabolism regulation signal transduction histidine kinase|nr:ATP-binding protein [Pyrinomonadaceae bacterium]